jgi:hypothetical protein
MALFWCTHEWEEFQCTLFDLGKPDLTSAKNISDGEIKEVGNSYNDISYPNSQNTIVLYKKCNKCNKIEIIIQNGTYIFNFNKDYFRLVIEKYKKSIHDKETERLLNIGNKEFDNCKHLETQIIELNNCINAHKNKEKQLISTIKEYCTFIDKQSNIIKRYHKRNSFAPEYNKICETLEQCKTIIKSTDTTIIDDNIEQHSPYDNIQSTSSSTYELA